MNAGQKQNALSACAGEVQQYQHQEPRLHYANYVPEEIKQRPLEPATLDYTYYRTH